MKKILILICVTFISLYSRSYQLSKIPLLKMEVIDTNVNSCDSTCMNNILDEGKIFTFISSFDKNRNSSLKEEYLYYTSLFRINSNIQMDDQEIRIAILVPQKSIRKYASTTVNSVISYLLNNNVKFKLKVYNSIDEHIDSIENTLDEIRNDGFRYVIAPVTEIGARTVINNSEDLFIYIPTINKSKIGRASCRERVYAPV